MEPLYARAMLQWPMSLAAAALFGTTGFAIAVQGFEGCAPESMVRALLPAWRAMAITIVVFLPLMMLAQTAQMAQTSWPNAVSLIPEVLSQTHAGQVWRAMAPAAIILLLAAFVPMRGPARIATLWLLALAFILMEALLSHAIDRGAIAVTVYLVHEAAAGLWIGALSAFWIVSHRANPSKPWIARAARAVSTIAAWSVGAIVLSGTFTAYQGIGFDLDRLLYSSYGRTLMIKVVAFCAVLSIGAYSRERLIPEIAEAGAQRMLLRNVAVESLALGLVVMALAALLANTPPAVGHMAMRAGMAM
jgi:putative copper resistance protein D